jgi:hypothetical protein
LKRKSEFLALTDAIWSLIEEEAARTGLLHGKAPGEAQAELAT